MLKDHSLIHLDEHGRVSVGDAELEAMIQAEEISLFGRGGSNSLCNNDDDRCQGSTNAHCANYPGHCSDSSNTRCNPNPPPPFPRPPQPE